jgi:hypothetical protein
VRSPLGGGARSGDHSYAAGPRTLAWVRVARTGGCSGMGARSRPALRIDHVELDRHYYSVPYQLVGERVDVRASARTIEVFARGRRVASHPRSSAIGRHTTETAHMPETHRRHLEWTPGRLVAWGEQTGPATGALVAAILASRPHPEQGFRSCLGIFRLGRRHGEARLEAAAGRALAAGAISYRSVDSSMRTLAPFQTAYSYGIAGSGRRAGRSSSANRLARDPSSFLKGRALSQATRSRIARFASARLKNRRLRSAARIQRSASRTPCSTFALSRGLCGRAGMTAVP